MKIHYALDDDQRSIVRPALERALPMVPREFYEIYVSWEPVETDVISITARAQYRLINIEVGKGFFCSDEETRNLQMVHEICHLFIAPLHNVFRTTVEAFAEGDSPQAKIAFEHWDQFEERAVCDISWTFNNFIKELDDG